MPTLQDIDRRLAAEIAAARGPLIAALTEAASGKPWHYVLFGSLARNTARRGSDAEIAMVDAGRDWAEAEQAAWWACEALGLKGDVMRWEDLADRVRLSAEADGILCG